MLKDLLNHLKQEWDALISAPWAFVFILFLSFIVALYVAKWRYEGIIHRLKERIEALLEKLKFGETSLPGESILSKVIQNAGIFGVCETRRKAMKVFSKALSDEFKEIMVIGSSLKGLLQCYEYEEIANILRAKVEGNRNQVKFLFTHPVFADFRAIQEGRDLMEIGVEIIQSLEILKKWNVPSENVRFYLGTPTCFGIKTSKYILLNPYSYLSVSYNSPCLLLEFPEETIPDKSGFFYQEFNAHHFGAWDTKLSVRINDIGETITFFKGMLSEYAILVENFFAKGKSFH